MSKPAVLRIPGEFAICRLPADQAVPPWLSGKPFTSVTRTGDELSIVCPASDVPAHVHQEGGWQVLKLQGPFAFTETGVLLGLLQPLAQAKVGILAFSTFDTDYVLVKSTQSAAAAAALAAAGYEVL